MLEKMFAGIIGFTVGDALGVPIEFLDRGDLQNHPLREMVGYGSHSVPEGTWSDDTSLMLATIDSINECGNIDYEDIMSKFVQWLKLAKYTATNEVFDIGISTRNALMNFIHGEKAVKCGMKGVNENGNGSLMRILPFVYFLKFTSDSDNNKTEVINNASCLTHAHEISQLGCKIYSDYVSMILDGIDKDTAYHLLQKIDYSMHYSSDSIQKYQRILRENIKNIDISQIKSSGYIVDSLEASLWCTLNNNNYEEAVISAINLGEDTDTIGAITGSINGILYGMDSIPERWLNKIKRRDYLENLANQFLFSITNKETQKNYR